jgi:hypothetical protein
MSAGSRTESHAQACRIIALKQVSEASERLHSLLRLIDVEPAADNHSSAMADRLERICRVAVRILPADGAGITLMGSDARPIGTIAASSPPFRELEEIQFTLGEGPCIEASALRSPVLEENLGREGRRRWPAYAAAAQDAGVNAVFAFPIHVGAARLGVLDVYRYREAALTLESLRDALGLARICLTTMLSLPSGEPVAEAVDGMGDAFGLSLEVYQAQGVVMMQLGVSLAEAMVRLRAHAYAGGRPIEDVAREVLAGTIVFTREDV